MIGFTKELDDFIEHFLIELQTRIKGQVTDIVVYQVDYSDHDHDGNKVPVKIRTTHVLQSTVGNEESLTGEQDLIQFKSDSSLDGDFPVLHESPAPSQHEWLERDRDPHQF